MAKPRVEVSPVRELRTRKRTRDGSRGRSVQGRLSIEIRNEDEAGGEPAKAEPTAKSSGFRRPPKATGSNQDKSSPGARPAAPAFHPLAYRSVVADWPIAWRELWGRRANELEEGGLSWRDAETQAFVELWHRLQHEGHAALETPAEPAAGDDASPGTGPDASSRIDVESPPVDPASSPAE